MKDFERRERQRERKRERKRGKGRNVRSNKSLTRYNRFDSRAAVRKSTHAAISSAAGLSSSPSFTPFVGDGDKKKRNSPERPPDVEAHRVQPEERSQEKEVRHDC